MKAHRVPCECPSNVLTVQNPLSQFLLRRYRSANTFFHYNNVVDERCGRRCGLPVSCCQVVPMNQAACDDPRETTPTLSYCMNTIANNEAHTHTHTHSHTHTHTLTHTYPPTQTHPHSHTHTHTHSIAYSASFFQSQGSLQTLYQLLLT